MLGATLDGIVTEIYFAISPLGWQVKSLFPLNGYGRSGLQIKTQSKIRLIKIANLNSCMPRLSHCV